MAVFFFAGQNRSGRILHGELLFGPLQRLSLMKRQRLLLIVLGCFASGVLAGAWFMRSSPQSVGGTITGRATGRTPRLAAGRRQTAYYLFRSASRRLRIAGRRHGGVMGGARPSRQVRLGDERRHRPLARGRRTAGPATQERGRTRRRVCSASLPKCSTSTTANCCPRWKIAAPSRASSANGRRTSS